jgi:type I restriction enzyme R subunit
VPPTGDFDPDNLPDGAVIVDGIVDGDDGGKRQKFYVDNVEVTVVSERVEYRDADGNLVTESFRDYTRNAIRRDFRSLDDFLTHWSEADKKSAIIKELEAHGVFWEGLRDEVGAEYSAFDLVCHIAFDQPPLTRRERANNVRKQNYFAKYKDKARAVLEALLEKYADEDVTEIESNKVLQVSPFTEAGTPLEIAKLFGGKKQYEQAVADLVDALYAS